MRAKLIKVSNSDILRILNWKKLSHLPTLTGLPEDLRVHSIFNCPEMRGVCLIVEHKSFDDIPACDPLPDDDCEMVLVDLEQLKKDLREVKHEKDTCSDTEAV